MILLDFAWCCMVLHDFGALFLCPARDASAGDAGVRGDALFAAAHGCHVDFLLDFAC